MTDTEAKALALELDRIANQLYAGDPTPIIVQAVLYIHSTLGTEARHAAELRELKERFSEACLAVKANYDGLAFPTLDPFILPAPDPLKSWLHKSGYEGNSVVEQALADLAQNGGKIVWEAGE